MDTGNPTSLAAPIESRTHSSNHAHRREQRQAAQAKAAGSGWPLRSNVRASIRPEEVNRAVVLMQRCA